MAGWELDDPEFLAVCDNNRVFFECLLEQVWTFVAFEAAELMVLTSRPGQVREEHRGPREQDMGGGSGSKVPLSFSLSNLQ